jgi:hypothetical protein
LDKWTDNQTDKIVKKFAKFSGWNGSNDDNVASAIGFLERKYCVNYDQRYAADVGNALRMGTKNHHMKSLGHSPDIIGLFFSILSQFTDTSWFLSDGELIKIDTETFELKGGNFIAKLFCGIANWLGHLMSDVAGSSGSRGNDGRGTGIVAPFYELFGYCNFGSFQVGKDRQDLATIATRAFQQGYDFRHCVSATLPVLVTELSIKFIWAIRRHFQYGKPIGECIPDSSHDELRIMVLVGDGVLCLFDGVDATVRSGGNFLILFTRLNLVAWFRLARLALKEVCIRVGIGKEHQKNIPAYERIDGAINYNTKRLGQSTQIETNDNFIDKMDNANNETELGRLINNLM